MSKEERTVQISTPLRDRLRESVKGTGGYQSLVRDIQARLDDGVLRVNEELVDRIEHYAYDYGAGGWQTLLRDLLAELKLSPSSR